MNGDVRVMSVEVSYVSTPESRNVPVSVFGVVVLDYVNTYDATIVTTLN